MLRRHRQVRTQLHQLLDAVIFALSFWSAWALRSNQGVMDLLGLPPVSAFDSYFWLYIALIPAGPLVLEAQGFYDRPMLSPRRLAFWPLFKGCFITTIGLIMALFFFRRELARSVPILFGFISFVFILLKEEFLRIGLRSKFARAQLQRRFILVGAPGETAHMRRQLVENPEDGMVVLKELDLNETSIERLAECLHEHSVNGVILNAKHTYFERVEAAIHACELEGIEVWLVADFFKTLISRASFDDFHGRPVMVFSTGPEASMQSVLKKAMDFILAVFLVIVLSPLFLVVALLIKFSSKGPVLFRQNRCGLNGQPFTIYKFRTMVTNAEMRKEELAALNEMSGPVFKMKNDPRVTPVGRWLRRFSVDEFPQLFNVLRGEMSLVGPRPLPVDEVRRFDQTSYRRRLSVKPGLTCLWQVSGRNEVSDFKDWVRLDLEYIDNWSLWLDLKIIFRTIPVLFTGVGAR